MNREPRFLRETEYAVDAATPSTEDKTGIDQAEASAPAAETPEQGPTPEQRAVYEAWLVGRLDEVAPRRCIACESRDCAPVYVLLEYGGSEVAQRYSLFGATSIQRSTLTPRVFPMCATCYGRVAANRRRHRIGSYVVGVGSVMGAGSMVAGLAMAPTAVTLALLFGSGSVIALAMVYAAFNLRSLHALLRLPKIPGIDVLLVSRDREELLRMLDRLRLSSLELQSEIERKASEASALPAARTVVK